LDRCIARRRDKMFKNVKTVAVYVGNKQRAKKFYTEVLGFELHADLGPDLCFLRSKSREVYIYLEGGKKPGSVDKDTTRLSFLLETEKSVFDAFSTLKSAGVTILQDEPEQVGDDIYCFQFEDPDGNILEVTGKP
jgi:catechol 2,3-dioxygenase-like lactoylglutathione lyase family enzyme